MAVGGFNWKLRCDGTDFLLEAFYLNAVIATYTKSMSEWDCQGPNTLDYQSDDGSCTGWPPTITITPD